MKAVPQIVVIVLITAIAVPVAARFVPGTRPWLDRAGVLQPLTLAGIVPAEAADEKAAPGPRGAGGRGAAVVVASEVTTDTVRDVISAIGTGRGVQAVDLSFEVTGRLAAIRVAPGDKVAVGDVIAELDAEAAQLSVDQARLVLEDRQKTADRLGQLVQSGASTALQRQDAELALRTAELALQSAERDLADHKLLAPVAGYVGLVEPQVGDLVSSSTVLTRIEDRSSLMVDFRVPERVAARVRIGDPIQATAISTPGESIEGRIVAVDNRVDEASRSLRVQAVIGNSDDKLRAGMAFRIDLVFTGEDYPSVDPLAIQWGGDGAFVWVVREAKAVKVPIRIIQRNAGAVLVEAAFEPSDMVVTEGVQALRPGAEVTVAEGGS
jgi:RND family efflux transporter MFP subunit